MKTILALLFTTATFCARAQDTTIVKLEYAIDADPGIGNAGSINIPAADNVSFPFNINLTGYSTGYHKLYIRIKDNLGRWSLTARRNIEVLPLHAHNNVTGGEYFIDTDPGFGAAFPISATQTDTIVLQNFNVSTTGLTEGFHKLYGRFKDSSGKWSETFRRNIEVIKSVNNKVLNGEYFFRTDNGFGDCSPVVFTIPSADSTFSFNISANQVPANADTLFIRVRDDIESRWSLTKWIDSISQTVLPLTLLNFTITKQNSTAKLDWQTANEINTAYFNVQRSADAINFTTVGNVTAKPINSSQTDYSYADDISNLKAGKVYYRLQMMDNDGKSTYSRIAHVTINIDGIHFTIYPNPARKYFVIGHYENMDISHASVVVRDMTGRLLIRQKFNNTTEQKINIASLSGGLYMISIVTPANVHTQKLLVE